MGEDGLTLITPDLEDSGRRRGWVWDREFEGEAALAATRPDVWDHRPRWKDRHRGSSQTGTTTSDMTLETKDDLEKITIALNNAVLDPPIYSPPPAAFGAGGPRYWLFSCIGATIPSIVIQAKAIRPVECLEQRRIFYPQIRCRNWWQRCYSYCPSSIIDLYPTLQSLNRTILRPRS